MIKKIALLFVLVVVVLALAACGGSSDGAATTGGDAKAGEALFNQQVIGAQAGCVTCHSLTPDTVIVGPSLAGIGTRAATRVAGMSAQEYIRTSIIHPDDYVVEGFQPGVMVQVWEQELSASQIDNLIAYLLTLK